ncbi:MAG TPA: cytosine permease, partial [Actinopolymorphaceae bacterium]
GSVRIRTGTRRLRKGARRSQAARGTRRSPTTHDATRAGREPARVTQREHADGRVELLDPAALSGGGYANGELVPTPIRQRTWTTYNHTALWMGMALNIPSYLLAAGLIDLGMNWPQAFLTIAVGNVLVLVPMLLNSHAGTKYGIPFPVFARAFFGIRGANLPAPLRAFVACGWFGIQTWAGGSSRLRHRR